MSKPAISLHHTYYRAVEGTVQTAIPYALREGKYACHWNGQRVMILAYVLATEYSKTLEEAFVEEVALEDLDRQRASATVSALPQGTQVPTGAHSRLHSEAAHI